MRVAIATDHAGETLLDAAVDAVRAAGHDPLVIGQATEGDDYPDVALAVGGALRTGRAQRGIVLCGSGAGVTVAANKIPLVRAAMATETYTARQMVEHDDVNVLALGARVMGPAVASDVVRAFVGAGFSGAARHSRRLGKVLAMEATRVHPAAADLIERGQRLWVDGFHAGQLDDGRVAHWIGDLGASGMAAAPDVLAAALGEGHYADHLAGRGVSAAGAAGAAEAGAGAAGAAGAEPNALALAVLLADAAVAADLLTGVHAATAGADGYALMALPPALADDADATVELARRVHAAVARRNVMVTVPATPAGAAALRRLVAEGIGVHSSLVCSVEQYRAVARAYLDGIAQRLEAGDDPAVGALVSVPVAAWDRDAGGDLPPGLEGALGLQIARSIADAAREVWTGDAGLAPLAAGALPQRLGFTDLAPPDGRPATSYVEALDVPDAVLLLRRALLDALEAGGGADPPVAAVDPARLDKAGVELDARAGRLRGAGLRRAADAWDGLLTALAAAAARPGGDA